MVTCLGYEYLDKLYHAIGDPDDVAPGTKY